MSNDEMVAHLRSVDLFSGLSDKDLRAIADCGSVHEHPAGSVMAEQDQTGIGFHLILSGAAEAEVSGQPRGTMRVGDYFGEISLIDGEPRSATVRVGPDGATTFSVTSWRFTPLLEQYPEITRALLKVLCARLRRAESSATG